MTRQQTDIMTDCNPGEGRIQEAFIYKRIFAYGSLQFCGHIEEYFAGTSHDLMIFIIQPRVGPHRNVLRRYHEGVRVEERSVRSSQNVIFYYLFWYLNHVKELLGFSQGNMTLVLGGHPLVFFGMGFFKLIRPLVFAYWIGDFFPSSHALIRIYECVKKWYQNHVTYAFYLTDAINKVMNNGQVVDTPRRRTVMWGLKQYPVVPTQSLTPFRLLFVGLIRPGQGLEKLFGFLKHHKGYHLSLIGVGQPLYCAELRRLLELDGLTERVFFPNRFYSEHELLEVAQNSHVGIALYDMGAENFTHYADPGKIKAYAEMNLPVVMTRISDIVPYVDRFKSGEIIDQIDQVGCALERIRKNYPAYLAGVADFNIHFEYTRYYRESFKALEGCWS